MLTVADFVQQLPEAEYAARPPGGGAPGATDGL